MVGRFERFSFAIAEINKNWHKIATEEMMKCGLKGAHAVYLTALYQNPEGLTAPQLCDTCGKDKADVSRMMRMMEEKELVRKEGAYQGGYGGIYLLTDRGREIGEHIQSRVHTAVDYAGRDLTEEQREIFYDSLETIRKRLRELSEKGIPQM